VKFGPSLNSHILLTQRARRILETLGERTDRHGGDRERQEGEGEKGNREKGYNQDFRREIEEEQ